MVADVKQTLSVGVGKKTRRKAKRALRHHRRVRVQLRVTVQDAAGNKTSKSTTIKVKRRARLGPVPAATLETVGPAS